MEKKTQTEFFNYHDKITGEKKKKKKKKKSKETLKRSLIYY